MEGMQQLDRGEINPNPKWEYFQMPALPEFENVHRSKSETRERIGNVPRILDYLNSIPPKLVGSEFSLIIAELNKFYPYYKYRLQGYGESDMAEDTVKKEFGESLMTSPGSRERSVSEYTELVEKKFEDAKGSIIAVSDTHVSTYFAVEAALEKRAEKEQPMVAVFCFDNHPDVYEEDAEGFDPELKEESRRTLNEGNVFMALTGNGYIGGAVFIGPENEWVVDNANKLMRKASGHEDETYFYSLGASDFVTAKDGGIDRVVLDKKLREMVALAKEENVTNIILSVDIDVINAKRIGYTGFQYNPMELFNELARVKLPDKAPTELTKEEVEALYANMYFGLDSLEEAIDAMREQGMEKEAILGDLTKKSIANPINASIDDDSYDPRGFNLGDVGIGLDAITSACKDSGIEIGIKLSGGGRFVGDIIGLEGVDYKGFTAKAAKSLADRMAKSVESVS